MFAEIEIIQLLDVLIDNMEFEIQATNIYQTIDSECWLRSNLYEKRDDFNFP